MQFEWLQLLIIPAISKEESASYLEQKVSDGLDKGFICHETDLRSFNLPVQAASRIHE